jgi:ribosomal protein S9
VACPARLGGTILARAHLLQPDLRGILKVASFLTRDSRVVERKSSKPRPDKGQFSKR